MKARDDGLAARRLQDDEFGRYPLWQGSLLPLGCAAVANLSTRCVWITVGGRFATQREQAPSPQKPPPDRAQSSNAFTDLGDSRKLRRLRFTLLRWLTRLGPRAMATPIANTSITTRWAMREVNGV